MAARGDSLGALVREALQAAGFQGHGRSCYLTSEELIWTVTPEQLWGGPNWAVRVGLVDRALAPDLVWPTDGQAHLQTEPRFMIALTGADVEALDGRQLDEALCSDSRMTPDDRRDALLRMALALHSLLARNASRATLAAELQAGRLPSALILKELRAELDRA